MPHEIEHELEALANYKGVEEDPRAEEVARQDGAVGLPGRRVLGGFVSGHVGVFGEGVGPRSDGLDDLPCLGLVLGGNPQVRGTHSIRAFGFAFEHHGDALGLQPALHQQSVGGVGTRVDLHQSFLIHGSMVPRERPT